MKTAHWVRTNGSGMHHVAEACADVERRLGHDAAIVNLDLPQTWKEGHAVDADIHVNHTQFPTGQIEHIKRLTGKQPKTVFISHGIPEHNFELAVQDHLHGDIYDAHDYWMLMQHLIKISDATIVFTPRYKDIIGTMVPRCQTIDLVPMGVDKPFWLGGNPPPKLKGEPAVFMCENQNRIKWALDIFLAWPFVLRECWGTHLHAHRIPLDLQRFFLPLANSNGTAAHATISQRTFTHEQLREIWKAVDFNLATTPRGDNTLVTMQAEASGCPTISYTGNEYASYWMPEGDQREIAKVLCRIFSGDVEPRQKTPVPDIEEMGKAMIAVYERVLA